MISARIERPGQRMKPIAFEGRFGWLHAGTGKRGVVLCNTYGHEHVWTYNGMRHLADELSARGIWVLRFDYLGTGDSAGVDAQDDQFDSAVRDIHAAVDFLKSESGIEHVSLCGFRVGAAFALEAALQKPVDDLVLLAPVTSGRTYMRELSIVRKTWLDQLAPPLRAAQPETPFNVLGQVYGDAFKRALEGVDLAKRVKQAARAPARRALVMQARTGANDPLRDAFAALGVDVDTRLFEDLTGFVQETAFSTLPARTYGEAIEWMSDGCARGTLCALRSEWQQDCVIDTPEAIERVVWIGDEGLVGIVCEPRAMSTRGPAYLLTNTSASARVGDSRLAVRMARELARRGIASLRFDARGRGDSPRDPQVGQGHHTFSSIYASTATDDTAAAARWLSRQGYKSIITFGICSGAYHALKAGIVEPAITGVVAVNIPVFKQPQDKPADAPREAARNSMAGYAISVLDPAKWKSVLRGEKNLLPVARFVAGNLLARVRSRIADTLHLDALSASTGPVTEPLPMMRALDAKGVKTVLVHGAYDASMDLLSAHFGNGGARLSRLASVRVAILDDIDHALFNAASSAQVIALCESVIKQTDTHDVDVSLPQGAHAVS
jgi:alpha-beta hydrolase superfamily lysophospholipase